ncbi:hypothetical protein AK812_SmicGene43763 [Symbiodinium microadriaticum]|uniref:Uncharacterized protein n=1 Tax=Symbiodinium microadriaticum TaxID=2951 RepID=A0A1Q9C071_SYMMI|nr:hypothetical protein AK812_SmicGene43763 [Symbiodinium microadriaticum]
MMDHVDDPCDILHDYTGEEYQDQGIAHPTYEYQLVLPGSPYMINMRGRSDTFFDIDNFEAPSSHDVVYDKAQLGPQWTRDHLCLYADDSHLRFRFTSFEEFTSIMNDIRKICFVTFNGWIGHRNNLGDSHGLDELDEFFGGLRKPMQEEEIKLLKQDHSLIFFLRPGENSMISHLFQTAKSFKAKQAANPQWAPGQQPLKVIMAIAMFKELGARLEALCQDQTRLAQVKEFGWRDPATGWKFQRWNPQLKALEEDNSRSPVSDQMVANNLQKLCQALAQDTVHRFHCTRKMADVMESPATFQLDLSTRTALSLEAWAALMALQGCTVLQLGGFAYKRETLKPSPAVAKLKDMIYGRCLDATLQDAVEVNREIMMPFFADHQLYIELAHYRLLATITHHGAHPRTSQIEELLRHVCFMGLSEVMVSGKSKHARQGLRHKVGMVGHPTSSGALQFPIKRQIDGATY